MTVLPKPYLRSVLSFLSLFLFFAAAPVEAQDFEQGLQYYRQGDYRQAASIFSQLNTNQGYLFSGKSYYALRQYDVAQSNLNNISADAPAPLYYESLYTSALINFQQKRFGSALTKLLDIQQQDNLEELIRSADQIYRQILNYLTLDQRLSILDTDAPPQLKYDLLETGLDNLGFTDGRQLYDAYQRSAEDGEWRRKAGAFESSLQRGTEYRDAFGDPPARLEPPRGTTYTLGVALPAYEPDDQEFPIVKALYFGIRLAVQQYNEEHESTKVYVRYSDTGTSAGGIRPMMEQFAGEHYGDVVIGPLFSEQAESMIGVSGRIKVPAIAPLANSDLNVNGSYLFQANPTFGVHGRRMARYAVEEQGLKNFAVIADRNSNGAASAEAFREQAESLGARVNYYVLEDLQATAYSISEHTRRFGSDEPVDAIYAPFTGRSALTLIDLLIEDVRAMARPVTLLGSQEWQNLDLESSKYRDLTIFFSEATYTSGYGSGLSRFKNAYQRAYNTTGNQYAMIGYDVAGFVLDNLDQTGNPALLRDAMSSHPEYHGLVKDIRFDGGNVNMALKILEITRDGNLRVRER